MAVAPDLLVVVAGRAHQRERLRSVREHATAATTTTTTTTPTTIVWTAAELMERFATHAAFREGLVRDDVVARAAGAVALARVDALRPRLAPALDALRRELAHAHTSGRVLADAIDDDERGSGGDDEGGALGRAAEVRELVHLLASIERTLERSGIVDAAGGLQRALQRLRSGEKPGFLRGIGAIVIEHPLACTDLELSLLLALGRVVAVEFRLPGDRAGRGLLAAIEHLPRAIEAAHDVGGVSLVHEDLVDPTSALAPFSAAWYGADVVEDAPVSVEIAPDESAEAASVAAVIAAWKRTDPRARIALATRDGGESLDVFSDALAQHGISVRRRRRSLAHAPAARLLLDVMQMQLDGAPRERLLAVMTHPALRNALDATRGARVLRVLRAAAARSDVEDVTQPRGSYALRLARLRARAASRTVDIDEASAVVSNALAMCDALPARASWSAHLDALLALARMHLEVARRFGTADVIDALQRMRGAIARLADPPEPIELVAIARLVRAELDALAFADDASDDDESAVEVLALPDLAARAVDYVVIAGMVEGRMPATKRPPLWGDGDRRRLNALLRRTHGADAPRLRLVDDDPLEPSPVPRHAAQEPLWMAMALRAAARGVLLTASASDARGRELAPSVFLLEALRALGQPPQARRAGATWPREPSRRAVSLVQARLAVASLPGAAPSSLPMRVVQGARLARRMSDERARFFGRSVDVDAAQVRAPYAFAVDPRRVARAFGSSFGLRKDRPLTPTRLEALAQCPMHGFVQHVLKVDVDPAPGNALDARVLGTLAHAVLERFYGERHAQRVPFTRFSVDDRARLLRILEHESGPILVGQATGHLPTIRAAIDHLRGNLLRVVAGLARHPPVLAVEPTQFEVNIGTHARGADGAATAASFGPVPMQIAPDRTIFVGGIIDRVDEGSGGRVVVDYKTASAASVRSKARTTALLDTHFQLPLYLRLLEHWRPTAPAVALHGYLVSLRDGTTSDDVHVFPDLRERILDDERDDSLARAIGRVVLPILNGTLAPDERGACGFSDGASCRLQRICRVPQTATIDDDDDIATGGGTR